MRNVLIGLIMLVAVLGGTSCVRSHTTTTTDRDTTYQRREDSLGMDAIDKKAPQKVIKEIETVFMEIEKDCPEVPSDTIIKWKTQIKIITTHESLSGGSLKGESPDGKYRFEMKFKGNESVLVWDIAEPTYHEKTKEETVIDRTLWHFWKEFLISIIIAFVIGFILGKII